MQSTPSTKVMNIDLYLLPDLYDADNSKEYGVIIDLLRNSTMITKLFENGIYELVPISSVSSISEFKEFITFGERNSIKIKGFDYGNSPYEIKDLDFSRKKGVIYSTNGTRAIIRIGQYIPNLIIASMRNMESVVKHIKKIGADISIVLSGQNNLIALEDVYCGGFLMDSLLEGELDITMNDSAYLSLISYRAVKHSLKNAVRKTEHGKELIWKGFEKDIDMALEKNVTDLIPLYHEGIIHSIRHV